MRSCIRPMHGALKVLGTRTFPVDAKYKNNEEFEVEAVFTEGFKNWNLANLRFFSQALTPHGCFAITSRS
ncbi:MAG: hypothetical protein KF898_01790 [Parachlamydiales bacterium]|nr:hypothetical protein [Verrucomicrobiota bacterium]MBX3718362.1 hypothetical protein [Candidatus Acheromyda pituitae]